MVGFSELTQCVISTRDDAKTYDPADITGPGEDEPSIDIRLRILANGEWSYHTGDSSYDQDHRGYWGSASVGPDDSDLLCRTIAWDLIDQVAEMAAQDDDTEELVKELETVLHANKEGGMSQYHKQATEFLAKHNLAVDIRRTEVQTSPSWNRGKPHGMRYWVTVYSIPGSVRAPSELSFEFWDSVNNKQRGLKPHAYDILTSLSSAMSSPDTADGVYAEFGDMKPSQCQEIADFGRKVREFFSADEMTDLSEIN